MDQNWSVVSQSRDFDLNVNFQNAVLLTVPSLILFCFGAYQLISGVQLVTIYRKRERVWISAFKCLLLLALFAFAVLFTVDGVLKNIPSQIAGGSVVVVSVLFIAIVLVKVGLASSNPVVCIYYILLIAALAIRTRTAFMIESEPLVFRVCSISASAIVFLLFVIENWPSKQAYDCHAGECTLIGDTCVKPCPEERATFLSKITFSWLNGIMTLGYKKPLTDDDLWDLNSEDQAQVLNAKFQEKWNSQLSLQKPSLVKAIFYAVGMPFVFAAFFKLVQDILGFLQPQYLKAIIDFISKLNNSSDSDANAIQPSIQVGYIIAVAMLVTAVTQSIMLHQYFHRCVRTGLHLRSALVTAIYQKSLVISNASKQKYSTGEIVNLMSVDVQRFVDLCQYLHIAWSGPLQICLALYFLYQSMGPSIFAGVAVMIIMIPVNAALAVRMRKLHRAQMLNKDGRMKLMDEILNGIKVIKLYAWENTFMSKLFKVRTAELDTLKSIGLLAAYQSFTWSCTPFMVSCVTFAVYSVTSGQPLTTSQVFVSISLFNMLQFPLSMFPFVISALVETSVSLNRIYAFLTAQELDKNAVKREQKVYLEDQYAIEISNGQFAWSSQDSPLLHDINLRIRQGALTTIIGKVGSGKSSLLSCILGDMVRLGETPSVNVNGSIAYVGQQAWIMNASLRDNITFGLSFNQQLYDTVVDACALRQDVAMLPAQDMTEIGERGINLSGGQKQRVNLARAVYSGADIILLDDPLSAVDAHVGKHIFDKVLSQTGLLGKKTRVFVSHAIQYVPKSDFIIMIDDGRVIQGPCTYQEAMSQESYIEQFITTFLNQDDELDQAENDDTLISEVAQNEQSIGRQTDGRTVADSRGQSEKSLRTIADSKSNSASNLIPSNVQKVELQQQSGRLMMKEDAAIGSVDRSIYWAYARSCSFKAITVVIVFLIIAQVAQVSQNLWLKNWAAQSEANNGNINVGLYIGIYAAIGIVYSLFNVTVTILIWVFCAIRSSTVLHEDLYNAVVRSPMAFFDTTPLGRIVNRFSKDIYTVDEVLPRSWNSFFRTMFSVLTTLVVISASTPLFLVMAVPMAIIYYTVQQYYLRSSRELKRLDSVTKSPIYAHFSETLGGVSTIRAYGSNLRFLQENERRLDLNQRAYYPSVSSNRWLAMRLEFVGSLVIFGSALFAVISVVHFKNIDAGLAGLSISYALTITQSLNWTVRQSCEIETNIVSVERIVEYTKLKSEAPAIVETHRPPLTWPAKGMVEFRNYSTRYREGLDLVLRNLSFIVQAGEKIGICGRTGAGKSSMMLALFRLVEPVCGQIFIDGVDITQIGLQDLRSKLTIIPQDPVLFAGTVRENLDPYLKVNDNELWDALESCHLADHIRSLPEKLDAVVLQNGENFSIGQRQLICLARALVRKSKVLVLDEATASIDVQSDSLIQQTIRKEFKDCTVLTIAHRINTVMDSDRILVLSDGQIAEYDTPENLLKNQNSMFYGLAKEASLVN
ncbi:hypothetical protein MP228_010705 [Amoeboaphelidium protococcarum]|nr:hypothetical protein MP228_010705 [Amoeboaphelidium protococcarum]